MNKIVEQVIAQQDEAVVRLKRAAEWLQDLDAAPDDERILVAWLEWCAEDPRNLEAFEQSQQVWLGFGNSQSIYVSSPPSEIDARQAESGLRKRQQRMTRRKRARRRWIVSVAAVVAIAVGVVGMWRYLLPQEIVYITDVGSQRSEWLTDGSRLDLGGGSRVIVRYTRDRRDVQLVQGEGFFAVAHDTQRPFVVSAGPMQVIAVGTAFDVRLNAENTAVTVGQGRVKIEPSGDASASNPGEKASSTFANAGQRVTYTAATRQLVIASVDPDMAGSWRGGVLNFVAEPLADVVNDVNRYSARKIVIADADLGRRLFTGSIHQNNVGEWLDALESIFPLTADRDGPSVVLRSRAHAAAEKNRGR